MKKIWVAMMAFCVLGAGTGLMAKAPECMKNGVKYGVTRGSFRSEWWDYQERGMSYLDGECYEPALSDLEEAIKLRAPLMKKDCDQRRARTYGMHFTDYFSHREKGVALYNLGRMEDAEKELEFSLSCVESNKAQYFLDLARKKKLETSGADKSPPSLEIASPKDKSYVKEAEIQLQGQASDDTFVKEVWIAGEPLAFPAADKVIPFSQPVELQPGWNNIKLRAVDLTGKDTSRDYSLFLDQQGPEVTFQDIKQLAGANVEVAGEVVDESGVVKLTLNGQEVQLSAGRFSVRLDVSKDWKIWFKAVDKAGNETEGVINLASEPKGARREKQEPYRLAALENDWQTYPAVPWQPMSMRMQELGEADAQIALTELYWNLKEQYQNYTDTTPPEIKLRGLKTEQTVYFPELYLEALVTDANPIVELSINGKKLAKAQSKNIFFNQIIPLAVGSNKITLRAVDQKGNTAEKIIKVNRVTPAVHKMEERMVVSMLPFYQSGQVQEISPVAYDNLISAIVGQKRFNFVDRALVDKIVRELKLSAEQLVDPAYTLKVGKITGSEAMIIGFVKEAPNSIEVYAQLIDVDSGLILEEKDAFNRDKSLEALKYLTRGLAIRLREDFPILEGKVVKADGKNITLDLGYAQKMKPGMRVIFFVDSEMKDAETGMNLGYTTDKIGLGKIVSVSDRTSVAEPIGKNAGVSPDKKVITK